MNMNTGPRNIFTCIPVYHFTGNPKYLADLCAENEVIIPKVSDSEDEAELPISERDHGVVAEDDRLLSQLGSRELREDKTNHEGLDETADNRLKIDYL